MPSRRMETGEFSLFKHPVTAVLAAVLLAAAPSSAARAQVAQLPASSAEQAARNVAFASELSARASRLVTSIDQTEVLQATSVESYVAAIDGLSPEINRARGELLTMRDQLRALPRVGGEDAPVQLRAVDRIIEDTAGFLQRIDAMLAAYAEVAEGFRGDDRARAQRALDTLSGATMTLVDGQALMLRGRATLVGSDRSDYAHAEGIACLYDGFAAVMRVRLELIQPDEATDKIEAAGICVDRQVEFGRAALARERANPSRIPAARALEVRLAEISERIFSKMEEGNGVMNEVLAVLRAGGSEGDMTAQMDRFIVFERELAALGQEQARNLISRSPG